MYSKTHSSSDIKRLSVTHPGVVVDVDDSAVHISSFPVCEVHSNKQRAKRSITSKNRCECVFQDNRPGGVVGTHTHAPMSLRAGDSQRLLWTKQAPTSTRGATPTFAFLVVGENGQRKGCLCCGFLLLITA